VLIGPSARGLEVFRRHGTSQGESEIDFGFEAWYERDVPARDRAPRLRPAKRAVRTPQQARSRETRERIVAAAIAAFEEHGYDDTNTAAIARRAGIGVGTLYGYFPDKRKLMLEILDGTVSTMADMVVEALDPARWDVGQPRQHVRSTIEAVVGARNISPGLQRILWERHLRDPEFRDANMAIENRVRASLDDLFLVLRDRALLRDIDGHAASYVVHASVEWIATRLVLGEADVAREDVVEAATDMLTRYLFRD
jgi:AcrR family transcriptional regulator